ncbi:Soluble lytic murein transglycosylase [Sinobacterium norvegicum]|uniref:Soluble lytic murein transglycosylase n=1 Tax=Sinobacterium norvegicum TaxID=1641715 RepID=A0ABM9AGJ4_9GAMM|nr:transglycosylase SLT domain-containing protein [Sinobacterium norvegicum]CAH0992327.1 Soluble lytic murein transglycosylase [Sinobacterium norvegicum]
MSLHQFYRKSIACCTLPFLALTLNASHADNATASFASHAERSQQRQDFRRAVKLIDGNNPQQYQQLKAQLKNYPLYPYLDYFELRENTATTTIHDITAFSRQYPSLQYTSALVNRRLQYLGKHQRWQEYLRTAKAEPRDTTLRCYYYNALLQQGNQQKAYAGAERMWLVGQSQPAACDPLFKQWIADGQLTDALLWQRQVLAAKANNLSLTQYLHKKSKGQYQHYSQALLDAYRQPTRFSFQVTATQFPEVAADLITVASQRGAYQDPAQALRYWQSFSTAEQLLNQQQIASIELHIANRLLRSDKTNAFAAKVAIEQAEQSPRLSEHFLQLYLANLDWQGLNQFIAKLPAPVQQQNRWLYWQARSQEELGIEPELVAAHFQQLSSQRHYYGFLAAQRTGQPISFEHQPYSLLKQNKVTVGNNLQLQRIEELIALNYMQYARLEWNKLQNNATVASQSALGAYAIDQGWGNLAILQASHHKQHDNLGLRAPLAYRQPILKNAKQQKINPSWAFSIARQESLFNTAAQSSAGAVGLMQLMPATAKQVARKNKIPYKNAKDLTNPDTNIALGTHYLAQLKDRFDDNIVYATAAYNAGPYRVSKWLKQRPNLPNDVWTETVPYRETRNYVKNVVAFSLIYDHLIRSGEDFSVYQENTHVALQQQSVDQ